jgi:hypothetical protein
LPPGPTSWPSTTIRRSAACSPSQGEVGLAIARRLRYDRSIDVQILRLRREIEVDPAKPAFIVTQRGAGLFDAVVEAVR